jgi:predicted DNA-binding transcriptional regulator YafY
MHGSDVVEVRVRFAARVAKAAIAARVVAKQHIDRLENGDVEITFPVTDVEELIRWTLSWGSQAKILEPREARIRTRSLLTEITKNYAE